MQRRAGVTAPRARGPGLTWHSYVRSLTAPDSLCAAGMASRTRWPCPGRQDVPAIAHARHGGRPQVHCMMPSSTLRSW